MHGNHITVPHNLYPQLSLCSITEYHLGSLQLCPCDTRSDHLQDWLEWGKSIHKELDLHDKVGTWELVESPDTNIIRS